MVRDCPAYAAAGDAFLPRIGEFMKRLLLLLSFLILLLMQSAVFASENFELAAPRPHPIDAMVGEQLSYDVSFLWFDRLAEGAIRLIRGEQPGTYLAILEARTRGVAAVVTKNRREKFQTLMEVGPDGTLRPLVHSSHTIRGTGKGRREKITSYTFDYANQQVKYQKIKNNRIHADELLALETEGPVYDILSGFYNLRAGNFGRFDNQQIHMPTFHRKGIEEIVVAPIKAKSEKDQRFFGKDNVLCQVLLDPSVFGTKGRDLLVSFDGQSQPQRAVVKNVAGLGDVKGVLRQVVSPRRITN